MYFRLALREREKHQKLFSFIILQLAITFIITICCVSVLDKHYKRYGAFEPIIGKEGWFVYTNLGLRVPEIDAGIGKTGMEILHKYLGSTNIICSYSIFGEIRQDGNVLGLESVVYDKELIEIMNPDMTQGRWLKANSNNEVEAVISQNYYGLETGDLIYLSPYSEGEADQMIPVRIVGVLDENAEIIKMNYSAHMVDYHNFIFNLKDRLEIPLLIMQQEDFERLSSEWSQLREVLWPQGLLFMQYDENASEEEKNLYDKFIESNIEIAIKESLPTVEGKSISYLKDQISEIVPILFVFFAMTIMSTICVSVLEVKQHIKNLYIYRIVGIDKKGCFLIQFWVNLIILCEAAIVAILIYLILKKFGADFIFLEFGIYQIMTCMFIIFFWLGVVYIVQKKMLGDHELWRFKR